MKTAHDIILKPVITEAKMCIRDSFKLCHVFSS